MDQLTYAAWVRPLATVHTTDRAAVLSFARSMPDDFWDRPAVVEGWANRDILAHLAGGNDQLLQILLRTATGRAPLDRDALAPDTDAENAHRIAERRSWSISELIRELERDDAEVLELLAALTSDDERRRFDGFDLTLGQFLRIVEHERHDHEHLQQLNASRA